MDFFKAHEILKGPTVGACKASENDKNKLRKDKTDACKAVVEHLFSPVVRAMPEFSKLLCAVLDSLYIAHCDTDTNVWMVADECVAKLIRLHMHTFPELICFNLVQILQKKTQLFIPSTRTLRSAFRRFTEICCLLKPPRARKYVSPFLAILSDFSRSEDEALIETMASCIGTAYKTFAFYMAPEQAQSADSIFLPLLSHPLASLRRAGASCIASLSETFPIPRLNAVVDSMMNDELHKRGDSPSIRHGILTCVLCLSRIKRSALDDEDPIKPVIPKILSYCLENLKIEDQSCISASLEVILQLLVDHGTKYFLWDDPACTRLWDDISLILLKLAFEESSRISSKAVSIGCLAGLYKIRPKASHSLIFKDKALETAGKLVDLLSNQDPLLRGNTVTLLGEIISSNLKLKQESVLREICEVTAVVEVMIGCFRDRSSVTSKMACLSLQSCIDPLLHSGDCKLRECSMAIVAAFLGTSVDAYWLVKLEVASALCKIDYKALTFFESTLEGTPQLSGNIQRQALDFVLDLLASPDARIRHGASIALLEMPAHLWIPPQLDKKDFLESSSLWPVDPALKYHRGIELLMKTLIQKTLIAHPVAQLKGTYHTLLLLTRKYGSLFTGSAESPNPLCCYANDIMPLIIERLVGSSLGLDLDAHIDMISLVGQLARQDRSYFDPFSALILRHCLRLLNIICFIMENRNTPPSGKDLKPGNSYFTPSKATANFIGTFSSVQTYLDLFLRLHGAYSAYLTNASGNEQRSGAAGRGGSGSTSQVNDRFSETRSAVLETLALIIRCIGTRISQYHEEILFYLVKLFDDDPQGVSFCASELFKSLFTLQLPISPPSPQDNEHLFDSWHFERFEFCHQTAASSQQQAQTIIASFEPLVQIAMEKYYSSNDGKSKASILKLLVTMLDGGINYVQLDPEQTFLETVISQCEEETTYLIHPTDTFPAVVEFLHVLFAVKCNYSKLLSPETLLRIAKLPSLSTSSITWKASFAAFTSSISTMFCLALDKTPPILANYQEEFFKHVLSKFPEAQALEIIAIILFKVFPQRSMWEAYSRLATKTVTSFLKDLQLANFSDFWKLCTLCSLLHPVSFLHDSWGSLICSSGLTTSRILSNSTSSLFSQRIAPSSRLDSILTNLGLKWIPGFVVASRRGISIERELLLESVSFYMKSSPDTEIIKSSSSQDNVETYLISNLIDAALHSTSRLSGYLHLSELTSCVVLVLRSISMLIEHLAISSSQPILLLALENLNLLPHSVHPFKSILIADDSPLQLVQEICSMIKTLCTTEESAKEALLFYHEVLHAKLTAKDRSFCAQTNACTHSLLVEICRFMSISKMGIKISSAVLSAIIQSRSSLPIAGCLELVLSNTENFESTIQVIKSCVLPALSHHGAGNALFVISHLPPSIDVLKFIVDHLLSCEVPSLKRGVESQILRTLHYLKTSISTNESILKDLQLLFQKFCTISKTQMLFSEAAQLFQEVLQIKQEPIKPPTPQNDIQISEEGNFDLKTVNKDDLISFLSKRFKLSPFSSGPRFIPLIVSLGCNYFHDLLFSGEMDWSLPDFIESSSSNSVKSDICTYLKTRFSFYSSQPCSLEPLKQMDWLREVYLCSSFIVASNKFRDVITNLIKPSEFLELCSVFISQFLVQWRGKVGSPFDLIPIFQLTSISLYDLPSANISAESVPQVLSNLIPPLFETYRLVILSQSLQASALIEKSIQQSTYETRLSVMLQALIAGTIIGDLGEDCHYGRSFLNSMSTLLLTLARKFPDLLYPMLTGAPDAAETFDMPLFKLCQQIESPELSMRLSLFFLSTVGVESASHFLEVHGSFRAILTAPDPESLGISEELRCLSLRGITTLLLKACLQDKAEEHFRTVFTSPSFKYQHEYAINRAKLVNKLVPLQEIVNAAIARIRQVTIVSASQSFELQQRETIPNNQQSNEIVSSASSNSNANSTQKQDDMEFGIASLLFADVCREDNIKKFSFGQVSLKEIMKKRIFNWKGVNISSFISELISIIDVLLGINVDSPTAPQGQQQSQIAPKLSYLQIEAVYSLVLLSDLLDIEQSEWLLNLLTRFFSLLQDTTDFIFMSNIIVGILKGIAILAKNDLVSTKLVNDVVKYAFESENSSLAVSALTGIRFLLETQDSRLIPPPLYTFVTKFVSTELSKPSSERTVLHLLSTAFNLVESFPKESDTSGFVKKLLLSVIDRANQRDCSLVVSQAIFRGLGMLLASHSLSPEFSQQVEEFSLRKLQHPTHSSNSIRSFLALSLLLSCMYSGTTSETSVSPPTNNNSTPHSAQQQQQSSQLSPSPPLRLVEEGLGGSEASMSRMERVQTLFASIRRGLFSQQSNALVEVLSRLVVDVFKPEQALSFVLGEFAKHRSGQETMAMILFRVFSLIGPGTTIVCNWVCNCIPSFLQRQSKAIWTSTCVFIAASTSPLLRGLFLDVVQSVVDDHDLFVLAACEFLEMKSVDDHLRSELITTLSKIKDPPFTTVVSLSKKKEKDSNQQPQ